MNVYIKFICLTISVSLVSSVPVRQSLNGQWTARSTGEDITIPNATVPGGIFSDLMNNGLIDDIFYGTGDIDYKWVGETDWNYTTTFEVEESFLALQYVVLIFEGLDTFATITLNGVEIGTTQNMFVRYVFDITGQLQVGSNEISVYFSSPVQQAAALAEDPSNEYTIPPDCPAAEQNGICHINRIRKMQALFSWDWGPAFASVGIWKDVYLEAFDEVAIDFLTIKTQKNVDRNIWSIVVVMWVLADVDSVIEHSQINVTLHLENQNVELKSVGDSIQQHRRIAENEILIITGREVSLDDVNLWWPNGYGTQDLYNITVTYIGQNETDERTERIGFRTVDLVQEGLDEGFSFQFIVNDQPIFAKGANEIPLSILPEKGQDPDIVKRVLQTVRDTNMNMLRVWGGGVYESDYFYDLADEYGILIWQDFMFACAMYPADAAFLENVYDEVNHQQKRFRNHPSIIVWSGNNENEAALSGNWYNTTNNVTLYKDDYIKLYVDLIQPEISKITDLAMYLTSSPTNGVGSDEEDHVAENPNNPLYGDVHFYDYEQDSWDVSTFPIPRFASEYGYQSLPTIETWLTATDSLDNVGPDGDLLNHRQHHPNGNQQNLDLIDIQLQLPEVSSENYIQALIYFSQILQAQSVKVETEHYRSFKGRVDETGQGNTTGALYWQLNDVWVAPTWSGMDYTGRWKMLQYFTQDFFNPIIVTGRLTNDGSLEVYAIFDGIEAPEATVRAVVYVYRWNSLDQLLSVEFPVTLDPRVSVLVTTIDVPTALTTAGCGNDYAEARTNCFIHLHLMDQDNNDLAPPNYVFPEKLKNCDLPDASLEISSVTAVDEEGTTFNIEVTTDAVTLFVWLDSHDVRGRFSENGFLQVTPSKTVFFTAEEPITADDLSAILTITHLRDSAYI